MTPFATDIDLLHWEPNLMRDAAAAAQTLLTGTGALAGTSFTIAAGSLLDAHIGEDHAIVLGDPVAGSFPIVSIDSATTLTLSVLYDQLFAEGGAVPSSPAPDGAGSVSFSVRTFWPQRRIVSELLLQAAGVKPENASTITAPNALRRPCALGSLHLIYTALSAAAPDAAPLIVRADLYERLYRRALRSTAVEIDFNADGVPDTRRFLNTLLLHRV